MAVMSFEKIIRTSKAKWDILNPIPVGEGGMLSSPPYSIIV